MTLEKAQKLVGNQSKLSLRNTVFALSLHTWHNTPEENERLAACRLVLKYGTSLPRHDRGRVVHG